MDALIRLKSLGYQVEVHGQQLHLRYAAPGMPNPAVVRPLVATLRARKAEALNYLRTDVAGRRSELSNTTQFGTIAQDQAQGSPAMVVAMVHPLYRAGLPMRQQP